MRSTVLLWTLCPLAVTALGAGGAAGCGGTAVSSAEEWGAGRAGATASTESLQPEGGAIGGATGAGSDEWGSASAGAAGIASAGAASEIADGSRPGTTDAAGGSGGVAAGIAGAGAAGAGGASAEGDGGSDVAGSGARRATRQDVAPQRDCRGVDLPDDDFEDSNCDGVDGDLARAVFVSPDGDDAGDGSPVAPLRTLKYAVERAANTGKDVYLCQGTFREAVFQHGMGANLYGGYTCGSEVVRTGELARIESPARLPSKLEGVPEPVVIDRVSFTAADAQGPGESSVAVVVSHSQSVTFSHCEVKSGSGAAGIEGADGENAAPATVAGGNGEDASAVFCQYERAPCQDAPRGADPARTNEGGNYCLARDTFSWGGPGGDGGNLLIGLLDPGSGGPGIPAAPQPPEPPSEGARGSDGAPSKSGFGAVSLGGYVPTNGGQDGRPGESGDAGRGGHGGGTRELHHGDIPDGTFLVGGGGGQGGPGGCGGHPGRGGGAGGASLAMLVIESGVTLTWTRLVSGNGGSGAPGGQGGDGAAGGEPGIGGLSSCLDEVNCARERAHSGEAGAPGGRGGNGGPGAGGPSVPLVVVGPEPVLFAARFEPSAGGLGANSPQGRACDGESVDSKFVPLTVLDGQ